MEIEYTNFKGNWDDDCTYCGKSQKSHQVDSGTYQGKHYIHRQPCKEEQYEIRKKAVKTGIAMKSVVSIHNVSAYLWGLIPFKETIKLALGFIKNIFVSIKAMLYLKRTKPKPKKEDR